MSSRTTVRTETAADEMDARAGWAVKSIKTLIRDARETGEHSRDCFLSNAYADANTMRFFMQADYRFLRGP